MITTLALLTGTAAAAGAETPQAVRAASGAAAARGRNAGSGRGGRSGGGRERTAPGECLRSVLAGAGGANRGMVRGVLARSTGREVGSQAERWGLVSVGAHGRTVRLRHSTPVPRALLGGRTRSRPLPASR